MVEFTPIRMITPAILLLQTVYCWFCFYQAQFLEYDDNYGMLIHGFIVSLLTAAVLWLITPFKPAWVKTDYRVWLAWLVLGSPLTFILAAVYYSLIFGTSLKG